MKGLCALCEILGVLCGKIRSKQKKPQTFRSAAFRFLRHSELVSESVKMLIRY